MLNINNPRNLFGKVIYFLVYLVLYTWQLPQNLVGLAYMIYLRGEKMVFTQKSIEFYLCPTISGGVSFGSYIFISTNSAMRESVYDHEFGHCIQSRILGPLYLPLVGLASGIHCLVHDGKSNYYDFWTERWANNLGKIPGYKGERYYHKEGAIHTKYRELLEFYQKNFVVWQKK